MFHSFACEGYCVKEGWKSVLRDFKFPVTYVRGIQVRGQYLFDDLKDTATLWICGTRSRTTFGAQNALFVLDLSYQVRPSTLGNIALLPTRPIQLVRHGLTIREQSVTKNSHVHVGTNGVIRNRNLSTVETMKTRGSHVIKMKHTARSSIIFHCPSADCFCCATRACLYLDGTCGFGNRALVIGLIGLSCLCW